MKVSAPHRGWTSGRATPPLRPTPYAAKTANPAGRHLSFAEICPDDRGQLCCVDEVDAFLIGIEQCIDGLAIVDFSPITAYLPGAEGDLADLPTRPSEIAVS